MTEEVSKSCFYLMQNVFVASDFLPYSTQALMQAYMLAGSSGASLTAFHALEKFPEIMRLMLFPYAAMGTDEVGILNEIRKGTETRGLAYLERVMGADAQRVRFKVDFSRDSMAKSILHAASEANADLICCGAYGTKPHTTGIIGSMAATFVAYTRIPLYLIKNPTYSGPHRKILVAFLDPAYSANLLAWAVSFAIYNPGSDIEIVSPVSNLKTADPFGYYANFAPSERAVSGACERAIHKAAQAVQSLSVPFAYEAHAKAMSFRHHAPVQSAAGGILSVAEQIGADLIVIPTSQPSLEVDNSLRDTARNITEYATQNCLVIPISFLK